MIISHGSGSGFALDVIKAGNNEAIRVTKTSGSGNAMTISGGNFEAPTIVKTGGTSSQFLKADGSVDSSTYLTTGTAASTYLPLVGGTLTGALNGTSAAFTGAVSGSAVTITATTGIAGDFTNNSSTNETLRARNNGSGNIAAFRNLSAEVASITNSGGLTLSGALSGTSANFSGSVGIGTNTPEGSGLTVASGGILVSLDPGAARKVLELYATSTGAKVSSSYVGASSYGNLELLTSGLARLTIADTGGVTLTGALNGTSASFTGAATTPITCINDGQRQVGLFRTSLDGGFMTFQSSGANARGYIGNGAGISSLGETNFGIRSESDLILMSGGNNVRLTIASTGAATFSSSVTTKALSSTTSGAGNLTAYIGNSVTSASGSTGYGLAIESEASAATSYAMTVRNLAGSNTYFHISTETGRVGYVGIGTTSPSYKLQVNSPSGDWGMHSKGVSTAGSSYGLLIDAGMNNSDFALLIRSGDSSRTMYSLRGDGLINTGTSSASPYNNSTTGRSMVVESGGGLGYLVSTRESKANIESILNIDFVNQLNPVQFNYRKKDSESNTFSDELYENLSYGFIADEVEKLNKELVFYNEDGTLAGVEYNSMIAILTKAIQEQQIQIDSLKNQIK
jgi:hypothetical protein